MPASSRRQLSTALTFATNGTITSPVTDQESGEENQIRSVDLTSEAQQYRVKRRRRQCTFNPELQ